MPLSRTRLPLLVFTFAGLPLIVGCSSEPRGPESSGTRASESPAGDALEALAGRQGTAPDELARALTPPAWADGAVVARLSDAAMAPGLPAVLPLSEVMSAVRGARVAVAPVAAKNDAEALRLYASARLKAADGKLAEAITDLESAAAIDANSPQVWRALGDAQSASGRKQNAVASYQKAVALGLDEASVHWLLGREAMKVKAFEEALAAFVRAFDAPDLRAESDLGVLVDVDLAEALAASGRLTASHELLTHALGAQFAGLSYSRFRPELTEVYRRRPEMWLRAGDMACRLGRPEIGAADYAQAAALPSIDPTQISLRRVWAELAQGNSARASQLLLADIAKAQGRIDDRQVAAIVTLSGLPSVGRAVSTKIRAMAGESALSPTVAARLTRAGAAASAPSESRELLRDLVAMQPTDGGAVVDLLASYGADDAQGREQELVSLTKKSPIDAPVYASAALALGRGVDDMMKRLSARSDAESALLRGYLLGALGKPVEGLAAVRGVSESSPAKWRAVAELASLSGDRRAADDACAQMKAGSPEEMRALAAALGAAGRVREALEVSKKEIEARGAKVSNARLLMAAEYARAATDNASAEALLSRALEADRFDESAYEALLNMYAPGAAMADEGKLSATARALRQNIPSSRVMRTLQAQDSMSRSLWSMAQGQLLSLTEKNYESRGVLELLVSLWERTAKGEPEMTEQGENWLRERLAGRADSALLRASLARVLVARGKADEAEQLLAARTAVWPISDLCRLRERVLRESLGREKEASRLMEERLASSPPTASTAMEWLELLASRGEFEAAAAKVGEILPEDSLLPPEALLRLGQTLGRLSAETVLGKGESSCRAVASLFGRVIKGGVSLPPSVHVIRMEIVARGLPRERRMLLECVREFVKAQPELGLAGVNQAYKWVSESANVSEGLGFLEEYTNTVENPEADLVGVLIRETLSRGTGADAERVISGLKPMKVVREVLARVDAGAAASAGSDEMVRAELAYEMALQFASRDLSADSRALYRLALKFNPRHGWSANNLGYDLVESREDMVEGERLLEVAVSALPEEGSVLDSLAWLRFHQNRLADYQENGEARQGAVTLIGKAIAEGQDPSAEVLDHAGDIYWASGDRVKPLDLWRKAASVATFEAGALRQRNLAPGVIKRSEAIADRAKLKIAAAEKGEMPVLGVAGETK